MIKRIIKLTDLKNLAEEILPNFLERRLLILNGDLGSGKTSFVRELARIMAVVADEVSSPTFNLLNIYDSKFGEIYHYDLYRLEEISEIENLGLEEAMASKLIMIEWADKITSLLPDNRIEINIDFVAQEQDILNESRIYKIKI